MKTRLYDHKMWPYFLAFIIPFLIYLLGAAPSVVIEGDSGEIITGIKEFGVIHSPGFPGYMVLAKLFTLILGWIPVDKASNLFSGFCGAITSLLICRLGGRFKLPWTGMALGLTLAFADEFWYASLATEVYTLAILILVVLVEQTAFLDWESRRHRVFAGIASGLSVAIHVYSWALLPIVLAVSLKKIRNSKLRFFGLGEFLSGLLIGLLPYLYIPLRADSNHFVNEGAINSFARFWSHVSWILQRERVGAESHIALIDWLSAKATQCIYFAKEILHQWGPIGAALFLTALGLTSYDWFSNRNKNTEPQLRTFGTISIFSAIYMPMVIWFIFTGHDIDEGLLAEMSVHLLTFYLFLCLTFLYLIARRFNASFDKRVAFSLCLLPLSLLLWRGKSMNLSNNEIAIAHAEDLIMELPTHSILMGDSDNDLMPVTFLMAVKNQRQDLTLVNLMNGTDWNYENYRVRYPQVQWPSYSQTYYAPFVPLNIAEHSIFFSSWYGANAYLDVSKQRSKYDIAPIQGAFQLIEKGQDWSAKISQSIIEMQKTNSPRVPKTLLNFHMRDREKDVLAGHSEYYLRQAEYLAQRGHKESATEIARLGLSIATLGDTSYGKQVRETLFKLLNHLEQ